VVVLEVAGPLRDVVEDLDRAIQLALADGPRGVVCDLSLVFEGAEPGAVEVLATAGRHVRDWPTIPVAVACPDPQVRAALRAHPLGGHLIVTASTLPAVSAVLVTPHPAVEWLRLAPHPTAPRASRDFVERTLLDWGLGPLIPSASLVVSELVTNATINAGTDITVSVSSNLGALRLTVRDHSPDLPHERSYQQNVHGRGLFVVAGLSRAVGVLPTADGGKVVWAVLNAAPPRQGREVQNHRRRNR
jgi:anti-sigma regulatory factor (Ser/Thr protein kinase)